MSRIIGVFSSKGGVGKTTCSLNIAMAMHDMGNDTMLLDVNISALAAIQVLPIDMSWNQTDPGSNGSINNVSVKNVGSLNLTNFYIDVNTESLENVTPIGSGNSTFYAASGFIMFRNETPSDSIDFFHLGRIEWNLSEMLDTETPAISAGVINWSHGWYRKANGNEYLWKMENGTQAGAIGWCNASDTALIIKRNPENASGYNRDLSLTVATGSNDAQNANWSFFSFTEGPLATHCVAAYYDCTRIYIYKYDKSAGFTGCTTSRYLSTATLVPGEMLDKLKIKPSIPQGTPAGDTMQSIMTVFTYIAP